MQIEDYDFPIDIPIVREKNLFLYNFMIIPIFIEDEVNQQSVNYALDNDLPILIVKEKDDQNEFYDVGVIGNIMRKILLPDGKVKILFQGLASGKIEDIRVEGNDDETDIIFAKASLIKIKRYSKERLKMVVQTLKDYLVNFSKLSGNLPYELLKSLLDTEDPSRLCELIASYIKIDDQTAYKLFIETSIEKKIAQVMAILTKEINSIRVQKEIKEKIYSKMEQNNKEYFLKQQLKEIHRELGNEEDTQTEISQYRQKLEEIKKELPKEAYNEISKQIKRYDRIQQEGSSEAHILQNYLESVFEIPFGKYSKKRLQLKNVKDQLDKDHFALEKPKDRILEYFAVREFLEKRAQEKTPPGAKEQEDFHKEIKGNILCFAGPPGVGKTSLANSIAKALKRELIRIALGGMEDTNELRGHRRTYVGAMPGQIIQGLAQAKEMNPVVVFDEIDKAGRTHRGDLTSVLLEILDPEQNTHFRDYFINFGIDISQMIFITTANDVSKIPVPLRDRMEIIYINSYTPQEKIHIAKKYLIPQEMKKHGITTKELTISQGGLNIIIENYTRESGVRTLRRQIAKICRKSIRQMLESENFSKIAITNKNIKSFLEKEIFEHDSVDKNHQIGIANGLAWTPVGGDILKIEAIKTIGKGVVFLTGNLGDVMKESSKIAFSVVKLLIDQGELDIDTSLIPKLPSDKNSALLPSDIYKRFDVHLHIPQGAIPKDGPSAGITMACVIASIFTNRLLDKNVAMTGELTLSGKVLPIGGLKEKLIAAFKGKIKKALIPYKNYQKDLEDIPQEVRDNIEIIPVSTIDEVFREIFV